MNGYSEIYSGFISISKLSSFSVIYIQKQLWISEFFEMVPVYQQTKLKLLLEANPVAGSINKV